MFERTFWETKVKTRQQQICTLGSQDRCDSRRFRKGSQGAKSHTSDNWNMWERMEQLLSAAGGVIWHVCVHTHTCANEWGSLCVRRGTDTGGEHVCTNTSLHAGNAAHGDGTGLSQQEHSHPEPGKPCLPGSQHFSEPLETPQVVLGTLSTRQALINQSGFGGGLPRCSEGQNCVKRGCGRWEGPGWRKGFGELTADLLDYRGSVQRGTQQDTRYTLQGCRCDLT